MIKESLIVAGEREAKLDKLDDSVSIGKARGLCDHGGPYRPSRASAQSRERWSSAISDGTDGSRFGASATARGRRYNKWNINCWIV